MHVVLRLPAGSSDVDLAAQLGTHGIRVNPLTAYRHTNPLFPGLVLGFASLTPDRTHEVITTVAAASQARPDEFGGPASSEQ